jgi:C4-dicarboxylate transporter DctM subunit
LSLFVITVLIVVVLILLEIPVGFSFGAGALFYGLMGGTDITYHASQAFAQVSAFSLLALPLFIMSGTLMGTSGISDKLLNFINAFVGRKRGGLGVVLVVGCALFGAISGSASAAIAAIGKVIAPRMVKEGYDISYVTALIAVSSVLALMIPPSIPMIVFAIASRQSVAECFLATMIPGIALATVYSVLNLIFLRKNKKLKVNDPLPVKEIVKEIIFTGKDAIWALLMPIIVLGGIYGGIFSPTEAGAVALVYVFIVDHFINKGLTFKNTFNALSDSAALTGSVIVILFFLFTMSRGMVLARIPNQFAEMLLGISDNKVVILLIINLLLLLMGMVIDDISGGILAAIILMPVVQRIGVHPLHFAAIVGTNLGLGNISPPCAPLLYMAGGVTKIPLQSYFAPTMKFLLLGHFPMVFIVTFIPQISLFLPLLYRGH